MNPFRLAQNLASPNASGNPITLSDTVNYPPSSNVLIPIKQREGCVIKYLLCTELCQITFAS